jgi:hypothetical protein
MSRADQIAQAANERVASWPSLDANDRVALVEAAYPSRIHKLKSGGVLADTGGSYPVWFPDPGPARRLLLDLDLIAADSR